MKIIDRKKWNNTSVSHTTSDLIELNANANFFSDLKKLSRDVLIAAREQLRLLSSFVSIIRTI